MKLFDEILTGNSFISEGIVYDSGKVIGLLVPSTLYGYSSEGQYYVHGPAGIGDVPRHDCTNLWASIVATQSILFGSDDEVFAVKKLLEDDNTSRTVSYFCSIFKSASQVLYAVKQLQKAEVTILGCGGIGSISAVLLAGAGVRKFKIFDPDYIEKSNLNRQIFWRQADVGKPKVDILKEQLVSRFDNLEIVTEQISVSGETLHKYVSTSNAVLLSADEPLGVALDKAQQLSNRFGFTLVNCGYIHHSASISVYKSNSDINFGLDSPIKWNRNPFFIGPSFGPINAEIAGIVSSIILHDLVEIFQIESDEYQMFWESNIFPRRYAETL